MNGSRHSAVGSCVGSERLRASNTISGIPLLISHDIAPEALSLLPVFIILYVYAGLS